MAKRQEIERLIATKKALSEKYAHLACLTKSKPRKGTLLLHAEDYRRQAESLTHQLPK